VEEQVRVAAIHDAAGNISVLVVSPADAQPAGMKLEPWEYMHEIEVPDLALDANDAQIHVRLNEVIENFRVEIDTEVADMPKAQLVRKSSPQAY
jgi:hypothetical protein